MPVVGKKDADAHFEEAVKPALESLLSDLQRTTEVSRQDRHKGEPEEEVLSSGNILQHQHGASIQQDHSHQHPSRTSTQKHLNELSGANDVVANGGIGAQQQQQQGKHRDPMLEGDKLGIHTIPKGDCPQCGQAVIGPVVIALGRMWHPEHFCCAHCGDQIGHRNFYERQGKAYCETDYHDMFSARCNYCNGPIKERCVSALGKTFHVEHFVCAECGRTFGDEGFHERSNNAYCRDCFYRQFAPKCQGCKQPITQKFVTALSTHWHPECFCCQDCARPFTTASLYNKHGRLLCELCFHTRQGTICARCQLPIAGRCVSALGRKFHPEHFRKGGKSNKR